MEKNGLMEKLKKGKAYILVVMLQFGFAGMNILAKTALDKGMNHYTFSVYRNAIAALCFAPAALFFERKSRPPMTTANFLKIMLLAFIEPVFDQNLYYAAVKYTSATFAVAMCNIIPAITFLMAWILRLEKVNIKSIHSHAKIVGTLVTVCGAMIMTLIKGHVIGLPWTKTHTNITSHSTNSPQISHFDTIKGSIMIIVSCFGWASFFIVQAITMKTYPAQLSLTALICGLGSLQGVILTLIAEKRNSSVWAMHFDTKLLTTVYSGVICSGVQYYASGIVIKEKGPLFVTVFNPLGMIICAVMGSLILSEQLFLGSVLGAITIAIGLYMVIWGKSKDQNQSNGSDGEIIADQKKQQPTNDEQQITQAV